MSNNITIALDDQDSSETYSESERNSLQLRVGVGGQWYSSRDSIVDLSLSREAIIGLATALLRAAHQPIGNPAFVELHPSTPTHSTLAFGVYLHPKSCRRNIREQDFGVLERLLQ